MPYISYGPALLDEILPIRRSGLVVFVLDFWWFNAAYDDLPRTVPPPNKLPHWSVRRVLAPYWWLAAETISKTDFVRFLTLNPFTVGNNGLGLKAVLSGQGYDPQGAFTWLDQPLGRSRTTSRKRLTG